MRLVDAALVGVRNKTTWIGGAKAIAKRVLFEQRE